MFLNLFIFIVIFAYYALTVAFIVFLKIEIQEKLHATIKL